MNNSKNIFLRQIEKYTEFLSNISSEDISKLENGECTIRFALVEANKKQKIKKDSPKLFQENHFDPELVLSEMFKLSTREEGDKYLVAKCTSKLDFIVLAKKLDLPFEKKDSVEKIKNKIIEATIGFRLRSQAIQGQIH